MCASAWIQLSFDIGSAQLQRRRLTSDANDQQAPLKWVECTKSMHDWHWRQRLTRWTAGCGRGPILRCSCLAMYIRSCVSERAAHVSRLQERTGGLGQQGTQSDGRKEPSAVSQLCAYCLVPFHGCLSALDASARSEGMVGTSC